MATLIVTKDKGGAGRPALMTVIPPEREVPLAALRASGEQAGLDGLAFADLLSAITMHERAAARFALAAAEQTENPALRQLHQAFARAHADHVATLESLMDAVGLPPRYASPAARLTGYLAESATRAPLLAGSVDPRTLECANLDVALSLAEWCAADVRLLAKIAAEARPSKVTTELRDAVEALSADAGALERLRDMREQFLVAVVTRGGA